MFTPSLEAPNENKKIASKLAMTLISSLREKSNNGIPAVAIVKHADIDEFRKTRHW